MVILRKFLRIFQIYVLTEMYEQNYHERDGKQISSCPSKRACAIKNSCLVNIMSGLQYRRHERQTVPRGRQIRGSGRGLTYQARCFKPITAAAEPAMARRKSKSRGVLSYLKTTFCLDFSTGPHRMIATQVPLVTQSQVTAQWRTCQSLKGPFNLHRRCVQIQAKLPRDICYLTITNVEAEDLFTRMNIDYEFLCNSSVGGIENHQNKFSSVGDIENFQDKDRKFA